MRAPTTLGLAALLLLALGGLYLSHVSLAADPAHHAPQGDLLARLRATEQRAAAAEKLAADAIAHAREMRLARDAAAAGRPAPQAPVVAASTHRDAPPAAQSVEAAIESWLAAPPSLPAPPAAPPKRTPGPLSTYEPPAPPKRVHDGGASTEKKLTIAQSLGRKRETIADRVTHTPPAKKGPVSPYNPVKPYPGSLDVCYDHEERACLHISLHCVQATSPHALHRCRNKTVLQVSRRSVQQYKQQTMPAQRRRRGARLITSCATVTLTFVALLAFYQLEPLQVETTVSQPQIPKHQLRPPARVARHVDRQVPPKAQKHFYSQPSSSHTAAALTKRGWRQTKNPEEAEVLWYQRKQLIDWGHVQKWQLVNHVRRERDIGHKRNLARRLQGTAAARWVPETYDLSDKVQAANFAKVALEEEPSSAIKWLVKRPGTDGGKGIELVQNARDVLDGTSVKRSMKDRLAQRYVSDLLLTPDGRKFDLRVYWVVASFRPELVLYGGGTLRVSASNFTGGGKGTHLTNAAQQQGGHSSHDESTRRSMQELWDQLSSEKREGWPADPAAYVDCHIRKTIQDVWRAYESTEKHLLEPRETHDAFILLGLDVMIDANLNVYLSEVQSGCGLPTNTKAVRDVVLKLVPDLLDVVFAVKDASYNEKPPHAAAIALAEARGFEVLANGGATPEPRACRGL